MLFQMEFKVEEKNLGKCLAALAGVALDMQVPKALSNAAVHKGGVVRQVVPGASQASRVKEYLGHQKAGDRITSAEIRDAMIALGISKNNYSSLVSQLAKQGYLKTTDKRGMLLVL